MANGAWQFGVADQGSEGQGGGLSGGIPFNGSNGGGYQPSNDQLSWQYFQNLRSQLADRNAALNIQSQDIYPTGYNGDQNSWINFVDEYNRQYREQKNEDRSPFSMSSGTKDMYRNKYRKANLADTAAIESLKAGEWWMNLPSNLAGMAGNEQLAKDLKFNPEEFDLSNGFDMTDAGALGKFALSVPGMIPGGLFEGFGKGYEALTGAPVQEYRKKDGGGYEIADYQMDLSQRGAAGLDALIDVAGTFTGASGKVVSTIGKGFGRKAATKLEKGLESYLAGNVDEAARYAGEAEKLKKRSDNLNEFVSNMGKGAIERAGFKFGKAGQFAYNVGEEAGEEFAQSYLEDIRNKELNENSFDKAAQSAAWGALGGGLMHGVGAIANKAIHGRWDEEHSGGQNENVDPQAEIEAQDEQYKAFEKFADRNNVYRGREYTDAILRRGIDKQKSPASIPASASAYGTMFDDSLSLTQCRGTLGLLDGIVQTQDNGKSVHGLAEAFHTTDARINEISSIRDDAVRLNEWRRLLNEAKNAYGRVRLVVGRNPDTNGVGTFFVDLESIEEGYGVQLNRNAWKALGGDVDGDRYQTYFSMDRGMQTDGYLTDSLIDDMGHSRLHEDYTYWAKSDSAIDKQKRVINDALTAINKDVKARFGIEGNLLSKEDMKGILTRFEAAMKDPDTRLDSATKWFVEDIYGKLSASIRKINGADRGDAARYAADVEQALHVEATKTASTFDEVLSKEQLQVTNAAQSVLEDGRFLRSGDSRGMKSFAEFAGIFGYKTGTNIGMSFGNPIMRQTGGIRFETMKDLDIWFDHEMSHTDVQDVFERLIAFSFSLESIGADVENAIEGVFWSSVVDSTLTRFIAKHGRIDVSDGSWSDFEEMLAEEYENKVKDFNAAMERPSTQRFSTLKIAPQKNPDLAKTVAGRAQIFRQAFGNYCIESLVAIDNNHPLYGMTVNQIVSNYALRNAGAIAPFGNMPSFNKFFGHVIEDSGSNFRALESRYHNAIEEAAEELRTFGLTDIESLIHLTYDEEGNVTNVSFVTEEFPSLKFAIEAAHYIFGEDVCIQLGIGSMESFLTSKWGKEWMSGDVDRMMNAVFSAKATYLYNNAINLVSSGESNIDEELKNELIRLQSEGGIFESIILRRWESDGNLGFLRALTDLDISYQKKSQLWERSVQGDKAVGGLFAEMIATPNSEIGTSAFTNQLKNAKRSMAQVRQRSNMFNRKVLEKVKSHELSPEAKIRALKGFMSDSYTTMSTNAIASFLFSQRDVVKGMVEKGVAPNTADIVYQISEHFKDGQLFSYLEGLDFGFGNINIGSLQTNRVQLCAILSDPNKSFRVYDRRKNGYLYVTRDAIFEEVLGKEAASKLDPDTSWDAWVALFDRCPALLSIISPTHIGTMVKDGETSVQEGYVKTLDKAFDDYAKDSVNVDKQYKQRQLENRALSIAMRDPNWWSAFVAESGVSKAKSLAEAHDMTKDALKRHVNWLMTYASKNPNGQGYVDMVRMLGESSTRRAWHHIEQLHADNELATYLTQTFGTIDSHLYGQMSSGLMGIIVDTGFNSALTSRGYVIENDSIRKVSGQDSNESLADIFKKYLISQIDVDVIGDNFNIDSFKSALRESVQDQADILFILKNMIDDSLFRYDQLYNQFGRVDEVLGMLQTYKTNNPNDPDIDEIIDTVQKWKDGDLAGFSDLLFGEDIFSNTSKQFSPDVIPNEAVTDWDQKQFTDAVLNICDKYNFNEDKGKIKKSIAAAFDDSNPNSREEKENIKNYFNQIILNWELNKITPAGSTQNHLAPKQTVEAYRAMMKVGDKIREEIADNLEDVPDYLPELSFDFEDSMTSMMSAHMGMNAASGAITTGIGLDGGMLSCLAGFGLLDSFECGALPEIIDPGQLQDSDIGQSCRYTDADGKVHDGHIRNSSDVNRINALNVPVEIWRSSNCLCGGACSRCASMTPNAAQRGKDGSNKHSTTSRIIAHFINWMQEPRHLRAKKALGKLLAFDGPRQIDATLQKGYSVTEVSNNGTANSRQMLLNALNLRRSELSSRLHDAFTHPDVRGDLHFDEDGNNSESTMFANLMTNFVEVVVDGGGTYIVSASSLASDEVFDSKGYDFGFGPGVIPDTGVTINPVVMSLQEVAEAVVRKTADKYYSVTSDGGSMDADAIKKAANDAMFDWDEYNSNPITMSEFLDGIVPNPPRIESPVLGDSNPSTRMLWDELQNGVMSNVSSGSSSSVAKDMDKQAWGTIRSYNESIRKSLDAHAKKKLDQDNTSIVAVHGNDKFNSDINKIFDGNAATHKLGSVDTGNLPTHVDSNGNVHELAEIYIGNDPTEARRIYGSVSNKGRVFLLKATVASGMKDISDLDYRGSVTINGTQFAVLEPSYRKYLQSFIKDGIQLATTELDQSEITVAMGSMTKLGAADASHYTHPDVNVDKVFHSRVDIVATKLIDVSNNRVTLVDNRSDLANISLDDVVFGYYDNNLKNRNVGESSNEAQSYRAAVQFYLDRANNVDFNPNIITDVKQGDCIGLVRQYDYRGHAYYAPIFYEGTVAHTAEVVRVNQNWNGHVEYTASCQNVDYNGNADVKLDMYGIAYKSVGRTATEEILKKWAAIKDGGFGVINRADHMFDAQSVGSRLVELGDRLLWNNMYFFTRKAGVNAFFKRAGDSWIKRDDLNAELTDAMIVDLCDGNMNAWTAVGSGRIKIYKDAKMNERFQRATQEVLLLGGFPHLMFNSARVRYVADSSGVLTPVFEGLERRCFNPAAVFKNWNTDDFLGLWNGIDSRLCPATMDEDPDLSGQEKVFDREGRMLDYNTQSGKPERKITLVGPHFYTAGEGNAVSDLSRGASYSYQHILQQLLRSGVYNRNVREVMEALSVGVGDIEKITRTSSVEEELSEWRKHRGTSNATIRQSTYDRAGEIAKNPLWTSLEETRRQNFEAIVEDTSSPLPIVIGKDKTSAFDDPKTARDIETLVGQLNAALGNINLTTEEVVMMVRFKTGTTTHTNLGKDTITYDQFQNAVVSMLDNIKDGKLPIMSGRIGTRGNNRISIPLMPRGLVIRLSTSDVYQKRYNGDIKAILDEQYELLKASIADIKTLKDKAKQRALMQFADAMCYVNGFDPVSGNIIGDIYMYDLISAAKDFAFALTDYDPELFEKYEDACRISDDWANNVAHAETLRRTSRMEVDGEYKIANTSDPRNIMVYTMRQLSAARKAIGLTYIEMPLSNCLDRAVGQTGLSLAMGFGRLGIGPYATTEKMNPDIRRDMPKSDELKQFWSAMRDAQMLGVERDLLNNLYNGIDLKTAIENSVKEQGMIERISNKIMNIASGKDWGIEKQVQIFLDRFWQRSATEAPWWHMKMPGSNITVFEEKLSTDPVGLMVDLLSGSGEGKAADALLARQCLEFALAGDNAQKNLVSAIYTEYAKQSALSEFGMTTFVSPYFNYATNRLGRVLNAVSPICSLHYLAIEWFTKGPGANMSIKPGSEITFGDLGLEEYQVKSDLKEAIYCDMVHMGGTLVAMVLAGLAMNISGILEPPDDPDKRGNFEEWTFFGMRINANWWIEDSLGIALPLAVFATSAMRGEPRIDLITGGLAHYLGNNPLVKVSDAVRVLFDPMAELYQDYENDLEGYAKAMGRAPDIYTVAKGKATSFGLSYVSQFVTPGFLREIYQAGQGNEVAYKRIFETDQTGQLTLDAKQNNATQYTSYEDAVLRKFTKDNPVMGFLADILFRPETGYMNHEMPDRVIYDPEQMNSVEAFSIYEDPYTKRVLKPASEQLVVAQMVLATLQSNSVDSLVSQGFMIDYDTKNVVGQYIWDLIASENEQWSYLEQNGYLSYYNAPYGDYDENVSVISGMRQTHYNYINYLKDIYDNKLWSDKLKHITMYNQHNTEWAQDVNGDWYATGFEPSVIGWPVKIAPGESPNEPQYVMSRENDWQTQSEVTGNPTGQRALIAINEGRLNLQSKPKINSYSSDGTETGHSDLYKSVINEIGGTQNTNDNKKNTYPRYGYGGGGGGYRRGGGGGGYRSSSRSYTPSISAPNANAPVSAGYVPKASLPRLNASRIMDSDRFVQPNENYLRPDFETKGSREAYKRSDI